MAADRITVQVESVWYTSGSIGLKGGKGGAVAVAVALSRTAAPATLSDVDEANRAQFTWKAGAQTGTPRCQPTAAARNAIIFLFLFPI